VVLVVVAVSFAPTINEPNIGLGSPSGGIPNPTSVAAASNMPVAAAQVTYVETEPDGSIRIVHANVDEVCPTDKAGCAPLQQASQSSLTLGAPPQALVASPINDQLLVLAGRSGSHPGSVIVVPIPTPAASGAPETPAATSTPVATIAPATPPSTHTPPPATTAPSASPAASAASTPVPTPTGARSIAENVLVVGEARYSRDGRWLAFSAEPLDGSTGPDLYVWNGTDPSAVALTTDHATYFSSWLDDRILASRLVDPRVLGASPEASTARSTAAPASTAPAPASPASGSAAPGASGSGSPIVFQLHPVSFLMDPATHATQDLAKPDVWLPTVDITDRFVTYWDGTLLGGPGLGGDASGTGFANIQLGAGHLVLDGWLDPLDTTGAGGSAAPGSNGTAPPTAAATTAPDASASPAAGGSPVGPAGTPIELAPGPITAFEARFDPSGTRLAVWVADASDPTVGTLRLVVLDRGHGRVDPTLTPLPSVRALKGVSIDTGRLAWVTPPGQDGNQSTVQVLAWANDDFGQVETVPGAQLTIVH
ncbi:MAG TPA: hypothetical protein VFW20_01335, partial [Candidatus Limnocylindrales bacterium]|nr:hypothetical protein [Candidatus Limnocylindrales bacterium]